jgi:hypothetical protein
MKIVAINDAPAVSNEDGYIRGDVTDLNKILDCIDTCEGRNDALRAYIYTLRDLQRAHEQYAGDGSATRDDVDKAQAAVERAFKHLIVCQFALNEAS